MYFFYSGCIATCSQNYKFPNDVPQLAITCIDKEWHISGTEFDSIPHCERKFLSKKNSSFAIG